MRAVGDLDFSLLDDGSFVDELELSITDETTDRVCVPPNRTNLVDAPTVIDPLSYRPEVTADGVWLLSEIDMGKAGPSLWKCKISPFSEWIADGCAVLGCGGGGATYAAFLMARQSLRQGRKIRVISASALSDPDAWILPCGFMGSPSVSSERIPSGEEIPIACTNLMKYLGVEHVAAIISLVVLLLLRVSLMP